MLILTTVRTLLEDKAYGHFVTPGPPGETRPIVRISVDGSAMWLPATSPGR